MATKVVKKIYIGKKYQWLFIMILICSLPVIALAEEQEITPFTVEHQLGDDIQAKVNLHYGSRGEDVKLIQNYLLRNGFLRDKVDGLFGRLTLQAVKDFQQFMGLPVDGVVGGRTFEALKAYKPAVSAKQAGDIAPTRAELINDSPAVARRKMINDTLSRGAVVRTDKSQKIITSKKTTDIKNRYTEINSEELWQPVFKAGKNQEIGEADVKNIVNIPDQWRPIRLEATAYTRYDAGCTDYTYRGNYLQHGLVAVDPTVIPLGTRMFVPGYGFAVADDIGGAIKGHKVDLSMDTLAEAFAFGRRLITAYIIDWSLIH